MEQGRFKNAVTMAHQLIRPLIPQAQVIVDMTCGNGHDTVFLAETMSDDAVLYAFDIQEAAIRATKERVHKAGLQERHIIYEQGSHDELLANVQASPDIIVFNLGYLPSGDHSIYTKREITVKAVKICLNKIAENGIIMIAAYPGTPAGADEAAAVHSLLQGVPQKEFDISMWQPVNQIHCPPLLYMIQKRG